MELRNTFTVPVGMDDAWRVMLDVRQLAPCMPGATVDDVRGDEVLGRVKVKLGPIQITYKGKVVFLEKDEEKYRVVLDARAQELRGSGTAAATITARMEPVADGTEISVVTDLNVTGKPAQFGRGVMADVSERIVGQFAENLSRELQGGLLRPAGSSARGVPSAEDLQALPAPVAVASAPPSARNRPSAESLDLFGALGGAERFRGPALVAAGAAALALLLVFVAWVARRSK